MVYSVDWSSLAPIMHQGSHIPHHITIPQIEPPLTYALLWGVECKEEGKIAGSSRQGWNEEEDKGAQAANWKTLVLSLRELCPSVILPPTGSGLGRELNKLPSLQGALMKARGWGVLRIGRRKGINNLSEPLGLAWLGSSLIRAWKYLVSQWNWELV